MLDNFDAKLGNWPTLLGLGQARELEMISESAKASPHRFIEMQ
jgi:hypothetical protein